MSTVYLPLVMKSGELLYKRPGFCVGAAVGAILDTKVYQRLGLGVVGLNNFLWSRFEPEPGQLDFEYVMSFFRVWYAAKALGIAATLAVYGVPRWAQEDAVNGDSPIRWECIPRFVEVIGLVGRMIPELVYVQVMNEPDIAEGYEDHYGCLGDVGKYLEVMRQVGVLKRRLTNLEVSVGLTTYTGQFWEDFCTGGGLEWVDQVNVHFYHGWGQVDPPQLGEEFEAIRAKTKAPVWVTEANLLHDGEVVDEYLEAQRVWIYRQCGIVRGLGAEAFMPYALVSNWRNANILDRPAEAALEGLCGAWNN